MTNADLVALLERLYMIAEAASLLSLTMEISNTLTALRSGAVVLVPGELLNRISTHLFNIGIGKGGVVDGSTEAKLSAAIDHAMLAIAREGT